MPTFRASLPGVNAIPLDAQTLLGAGKQARKWYSDPKLWSADDPGHIRVSVSEIDSDGMPTGEPLVVLIGNPHTQNK